MTARLLRTIGTISTIAMSAALFAQLPSRVESPAYSAPYVLPAAAPDHVLSAHPGSQPLADPTSCTPAPAVCNQLTFGQLGPGDCTLPDGAYLDLLSFTGAAGDYVDVIVWPLDSTLTNPFLTISAPAGVDAPKAPAISGGLGGAWLTYILSSSGTWDVAVGSRDPSAKGRYAVKVSCSKDPAPQLPQSCVSQNLVCGQMVAWNLTRQSCAFSNSQPYANHYIYANAGDFLSADVVSQEFEPLAAIYAQNGGTALAIGSAPVGGKSTVSYFVETTGWYSILATISGDSSAGGAYTASVSCSNSGCIPPLLVEQPAPSRGVTAGERVTLSARAQGVGAMTYTWYEVDGATATPAGTGPTFTTQPVTSAHTFKVVARNVCGVHESGLITLTPAAVKRRAVRR